MLVAMEVLERDRVKSGNDAKGGSNTSSRSIKGASSKTLDFRGREDS